MNTWKILGIPPTDDIAKIKSAYAKQAKLYHPEEHPDEFKALQDAYKTAVKIAKSRKAGITITYSFPQKPADDSEQQAEAEEAPDADIPQVETEKAPDENIPQAEAEKAPDEDISKAEAEKAPDEDIPQAEAEEREVSLEEESAFDFSDVDSYGDREQFIRQFLLLAKNPYLQNRLGTWEYFLYQNTFVKLFASANFRAEVVRIICSLGGWRRKTLLYFERFLSMYHRQENRPEDGRWETDSPAFRLKKLPRLRLPAFCMDRFFRKEGKTFYKQIYRRVCKMACREIDLDVQIDLVRYSKLYLSYAESNEAYIDRLYRGWRFEQYVVLAAALGLCFFVVMTEISFSQARQESERQMKYLEELYDLDSETVSEEERKELQDDYNTYWKYGEDAIDDVLKRYEEWEGQ